MANATVTINGVHREVVQIAETVNGVYREVTAIPATVNGVYREGYVAYKPPVYADRSFSNVNVQNENMNFLGAQIPMSDFVTALNYGYTTFNVTITATTDRTKAGELYVGLTKNGEDLPYSISISGHTPYSWAGSYSTGEEPSYLPDSRTFTYAFDVASLISQVGANGYIQAGYKGNDYSGYSPRFWGSGSVSNMSFTK